MGWFIFAVVFLGLAIFVPLYTKKKVSTWEYRYRKDKGVCYFEDDKLIINAMGLQKPIGVPTNEIDHVVFFYDVKSNVNNLSFWHKTAQKAGTNIV